MLYNADYFKGVFFFAFNLKGGFEMLMSFFLDKTNTEIRENLTKYTRF